jgi:hypothetical protein
MTRFFLTRRELRCRGSMGMGALALSAIAGDAFGDVTRSAGNLDSPLAARHWTWTSDRIPGQR